MAVRAKEQILALLQEHQAQIKAFSVKRLALFGSFVRGQQGDSDVDVLVEFTPDGKTFDNFIQLASFLERLFGRRVELITPESLSPYLGPHILNEIEYVTFDTPIPATDHIGPRRWGDPRPYFLGLCLCYAAGYASEVIADAHLPCPQHQEVCQVEVLRDPLYHSTSTG